MDTKEENKDNDTPYHFVLDDSCEESSSEDSSSHSQGSLQGASTAPHFNEIAPLPPPDLVVHTHNLLGTAVTQEVEVSTPKTPERSAQESVREYTLGAQEGKRSASLVVRETCLVNDKCWNTYVYIFEMILI